VPQLPIFNLTYSLIDHPPFDSFVSAEKDALNFLSFFSASDSETSEIEPEQIDYSS